MGIKIRDFLLSSVSSVQNSGNLAGLLEKQVTGLRTSQSAWRLKAFLAGPSPEENILTNEEVYTNGF